MEVNNRKISPALWKETPVDATQPRVEMVYWFSCCSNQGALEVAKSVLHAQGLGKDFLCNAQIDWYTPHFSSGSNMLKEYQSNQVRVIQN